MSNEGVYRVHCAPIRRLKVFIFATNDNKIQGLEERVAWNSTDWKYLNL